MTFGLLSKLVHKDQPMFRSLPVTKVYLRMTVVIGLMWSVLVVAIVLITRGQSPNNQLAFLAQCNNNWDIYLLDVTRGNQINLTHDDHDENSLMWAADGQQLGYVYYEGVEMQLMLLNLATGQRRETTLEATPWLAAMIQPSPVRGDWANGQRVYELAGDIYLLDAAGNAYPITNDTFTDESPAWSPDARQITFVSDRGGSTDIYVMNADGRQMRRITQQLSTALSPRWSPDGQHIAFAAMTPRADLYIIKMDGSDLRRLTANACWNSSLTWRP